MRFKLRIVLLVAGVACLFGACSVSFNPEQDGKFLCNNDDDCLAGFECRAQGGQNSQGICRKLEDNSGRTCVDDDGDGYGTGEVRSSCQNPEAADCVDSASQLSCDGGGTCTLAGLTCTNGRCVAPVSQNQPDPQQISPGQGELCDGYDNNCNGTVDERSSCTDVSDCPTWHPDLSVRCESGKCKYVPPISRDCPISEFSCQNGSVKPPPENIPDKCK